MIKIELNNIKEFKNILSVTESILTEIKLEFDNDGFRFRGFDGGHTTYLEVDFKKDYFTDYIIDDIDNIIIDTSELNKVLKRIKNDDDTMLIIDDDMIILKVNSDGNEKTFKIHSIDVEYDTPTMPQVEYPVTGEIDFKKFKENVTDANLYEDKLRINVEKDNLIIHNKSMLGSYESKLKLDKTYEDNFSSVFNMSLISKFLKLSTLSDNVEINLGSDFPVFFVLHDEFEDINIKMLIAPIIEEEY